MAEIDRLLQGQHAYQVARARTYWTVTWAANRLTWLVFGLAMAAAGFHCIALGLGPVALRAAEWLVTASATALAAAAVQSVNAFLRLEGQRHEARSIADFLGKYLPAGDAPGGQRYSPEELSAIHHVLMAFEKQWVAESRRGGAFRPGS